MFRKMLDEGVAGDNIGRNTLRGVEQNEIERGQEKYLQNQNNTPHTPKFKASICMITKDEGGRHTPILQRIQTLNLLLRTTDVTGVVELKAEQEKW